MMENRACRWSAVEDKFVAKNYITLGIDECARQLNRPREGVKRRAFRLGVSVPIAPKKKSKDRCKFMCKVMLNDGDIQPLVIRATTRDEAKKHIESTYKTISKIVDIKEYAANPDLKRDYMGKGMNGGWAGVTTTKHFRKG